MKRLLTLFAITAMFVLTAAVAYATQDATVAITGGSLSVTPLNVSLSGVTLDGTDKTATSAFGSNAWKAEDARGTGVGWNVTIISTDFVDTSDPVKTIDISESDQLFKIQIETDNITVIAGSAKPASSVTDLTTIPFTGGTALKIVSAAADGTGMGEYNIPPAFSLMVPAETYVGTGTYTATMTIAVNSGPGS